MFIHIIVANITATPTIKCFNSSIIGINQTAKSVIAATNSKVMTKDIYIPTMVVANNKIGINVIR